MLLSSRLLGSRPRHPGPGFADLGECRKVLRRLPDQVEQRPPALGFDGLDESLAELVLLELGLDAEQALEDARGSPGVSALVQHTLEAVGAGDQSFPRPV